MIVMTKGKRKSLSFNVRGTDGWMRKVETRITAQTESVTESYNTVPNSADVN